ncbi:MAG: glucokinase [Gammaproteobacteria bacterium]|nr:MAG: glucokinase [Gammaproteobacteria bacterium]
MTTVHTLLGDIGGTNVRFAVMREQGGALELIDSRPCSQYGNLEAAIEDYLTLQGIDRVDAACIAVAAPVQGARIHLTNNSWQFDCEELRTRFGWRACHVVNDFTAMALGVPCVPETDLVHVCGGPAEGAGVRLVMGPGTGLGMSGLVPVGERWIALRTEGGHVDFAPTNEIEMAILRILQHRFGRVSVERILCGEGLLNLYRAHAEIVGGRAAFDAPEEISAAALAGIDDLAVRTLTHFCEILGRTAGNAALTLGATGGVFLCGGILPAIQSFFLKSPFRQGFEDKGRMRSIMEKTPVYLVTDPFTALRGAAEYTATGSMGGP